MSLTATSSRCPNRAISVLSSLFFILVLAFAGYAQSPIDDTTPPGQAPGAPAGSYALSGFDNVNLFNGNLNFALPLMRIGGRGETGYTITLPIEQRWTVETLDSITYIPNYNWWSTLPGYGPGALQGRQTSQGCEDTWQYTEGTTRLTFTMPDKTEYELIDQVFGGQPASSWCGGSFYDPFNGSSRGSTFVTRDGTSATFISDTVIKDVIMLTYSPRIIDPTGYLMLRDGTRYRIVNGRVEWMRDRNGNKLTFTYASRLTSVTDSMNRQVTFDYDVSDAQCGVCDRINFKGTGGVSRKIWVVYKNLGQALASGQSLKTYGGASGLFPELSGSTITYHDPRVLASVILPDTRTYQFWYNSYGELVKVKLPTTGTITYDWGPGAEGGLASGVIFPHEIYRRVLERKTYTDDVSTLATHTSFGRYDNIYGPGDGSAWIKERAIDGSGTILTQSKHFFIDAPVGYIDDAPGWLPDHLGGREKQTEDYDAAGTTLLRRLTHTWANGGSLVGTPTNPRITQTVTTIEPSTANLVSKKTFSYDTYNNQTDIYEYAFGAGTAGAQVRRTHMDFLTTNPVNSINYATTASIHLRALVTQQQVFEGVTQRALTTYEYDNYATDTNHAGLVNRTSISGLDSGFTTGYGTRGNPTAVSRHLLNSSGGSTASFATYQQYDIAGSVVKGIDARGNATVMDLSDRYGAADGNAQANSGATELGLQVSYAFPAKITNSAGHIVYSQYDYYLGQPVDIEDANGAVSSLYRSDLLDRLTQVRRAVGTAVASQTTYTYDDGPRILTASSDLNSFGDNLLITRTLYDGLGRSTEARKYEGGSNYIVTQTQYDALGRAYKTSNPFRPWQGQSAVWTTQMFDAIGRVSSVTTPDGAAVSSSYSGNTVTVTDATGKKRKTVTDALGRLIEVYEDPTALNYQTIYTYDVLDNLVKVTQGTQQRFVMYDSLKRLIRERNPEQSTNAGLNLTDPVTGNSAWSNGYQYDANGNLTQKTDPRGVVSTYVYDVLNRNTTTDFSDTASINPDIKRFYDGATNGKGRFWYFYKGGDFSTGADVDHTSIDSYDALGRPTVQRQLFKLNSVWSPTYQVSRGYNLAGGVTSLTYPSGRTVAYTYDSAGRTSSFTGNLGDSVQRTYSTGITYSQWGSPSVEQFGTNSPVYNKQKYNIRGQLFDVRNSATNDDWGGELGVLVNHYSTSWIHGGSGTDNNGNVLMSQTIINGVYFEDRYSYDALNRLSAINEFQNGATQTGSQQYTYDRWGNRTINPASWGTGINAKQFSVDTATNRLGVPGGQPGTMSYDNAGNLTTDTYTSFGTRAYDAENKMTAAQDSLSGWSYYTYDADGNRTRRKIGGQETWQIYGLDSELLAEYAASSGAGSPQKENGYRNGELLIQTRGATCGAGYVGTKSWGATSGSLGHNTGQQEGTDWAAYVSSHSAQHMVFGPYDTTFGKGRHQAQFQLQVDNTSGTDVVATLDVVIGLGTTVLAQRLIRRNEFTAANTWQWFTVDFDNPCFGQAEARVWFNDTTNMKFRESRLSSAGAGGAKVHWLVADHLGTPRMIFDESGGYATLKRHDYLPFGEELLVGASGRAVNIGYGGGDSVRQQFAGNERDIETGLDYVQARYYSSPQGRFTSPDPLLASGHPLNPQSWNRYSYVLNSPLTLADPTGLAPEPGQTQDTPPPNRTIYIFVEFNVAEQQRIVDPDGPEQSFAAVPAPDFQSLVTGAPRGTNVVLRMGAESTVEAYNAALNDPNAVGVIFIGHAIPSAETSATRFAAGGVRFGETTEAQQTFDPAQPVTVRAQTVGVFACDSERTRGDYSLGPAQTFIGVHSGTEGLTTTNALTQAGFSAARTLISGGSPREASGAANNALQAAGAAMPNVRTPQRQMMDIRTASMNAGDYAGRVP